MKVWMAISVLMATPVFAQEYTEADALADLGACLNGASPEEVMACYGVAEAKCALVTPDPEVEFVELTCPEAEQFAWNELRQTESERAFHAIEARTEDLYAAHPDRSDYQQMLDAFLAAGESWTDYVNEACAPIGALYGFQAQSTLPEIRCQNRQNANRVAELRALALQFEQKVIR